MPRINKAQDHLCSRFVDNCKECLTSGGATRVVPPATQRKAFQKHSKSPGINRWQNQSGSCQDRIHSRPAGADLKAKYLLPR